jgi:ABC-type multidrug transport system ATPase subunit
MSPIISISDLTKTYASGLQALKNVNLEIRKGKIFALLGPNGAGKTTLISIICGIITPTKGTVIADGLVSDRCFRSVINECGSIVSYCGPTRGAIFNDCGPETVLVFGPGRRCFQVATVSHA